MSRSTKATASAAPPSFEQETVLLSTKGAIRLSTTEAQKRRRAGYQKDQDAELIASVREHGVLAAILVRTIKMEDVGDPSGYELIAGERRLRAAQAAGLDVIPAVVREMTDGDVEEAQLVENVQRADMHPLDEAQTLMELGTFAGGAPAVAARVGKSETYVVQRMRLVTLSDTAQKAYRAGRFELGHALLLARVTPELQDVTLREYLLDSRFGDGKGAPTRRTVRELRDWIHEQLMLDLDGAPFPRDDADLVPAAGPCTSCPKRTGSTPLLFADVKSRNTCTDRACFHTKVVTWLALRYAQAATEGKGAVYVTGYYSQEGSGRWLAGLKPRPLGQGQWAPAGKTLCDHTTVGVYAGGPSYERRAIGEQLKVCTAKTCKAHGRGTGYVDKTATSSRTAEQRTLALKAARRQAVGQIVERVAERPSGTQELRLIASGYVREMWHDSLKQLVVARGWMPERKKGGGRVDLKELIAKRIAGLAAQPLFGLLVEMVLTRSFNAGTFTGLDRTLALGPVAKRYGVDVGKLERAALRELAAKRKVRKAAARKKPTSGSSAKRQSVQKGAAS